jgi:ribosomal protein L11 methyltransferase
MNEYFIRLDFACPAAITEFLMAELGMKGFDAFLETENGFQTSIEKSKYRRIYLTRLADKYSAQGKISFSESEFQNRNWNEEWEKSYSPVTILNHVLIKTSFHKTRVKYPIEIIINPRMSFGTGHHETTQLMIEAMLGLDFNEKRVLDAGCGTGILSILAEKLGAAHVTGVDIDEIAIENARENAEINSCLSLFLEKSTAAKWHPSSPIDIILANINRNVLMEEIPYYHARLKDQGYLVTSGFINEDSALLCSVAGKSGFFRKTGQVRNQWACMVFQKKTD